MSDLAKALALRAGGGWGWGAGTGVKRAMKTSLASPCALSVAAISNRFSPGLRTMGSELNSAAWSPRGRKVAGIPLMVTTGRPELPMTMPRMLRGELPTSRICPEVETEGLTTRIDGGARAPLTVTWPLEL